LPSGELPSGDLMRALFVVPRYGAHVRGGAEQAARAVATRLADRGHDVTVLTTTATSYVDWSGDLVPGVEQAEGVEVHRLAVDPLRDPEGFDRLHHRIEVAGGASRMELQRAWLDAQGPSVPDLVPWLDEHAAAHDVAVFLPYLYATTTVGLPAAARHTACVLAPCAHDEPPLQLAAFDQVMRLAHRHVHLTPEEATLVRTRFRLRGPHHVAGLGTELEPHAGGGPDAFRTAHGLGEDPYLLYVGRIDPSKGTAWLADRFAAMAEARPGPLRLVMVGDPVVPVAEHPDIVVIDDLDDAGRTAAMAGAVALVHPSPFESFGMVVAEAWAVGTPVLALHHNAVLRGHVDRSGGGLTFGSGAELAEAAWSLVAEPERRDELGRAGRRHAEATFAWPAVLDRWEAALADAARIRTP
jgi:glycosyltransferase involved in cell wall biosynthesis